MANNATKTEHSGPKRGRGAFFGKKDWAKNDSNKKRRILGKKEIKENMPE